jgi:DNA-binding XRE family transcriptional regulator
MFVLFHVGELMETVTLSRKLRVRNVRAELRINGDQLAQMADVARVVVWKAETGKTISRISAYAMLRVFNGLRRDFNLPDLDIDDLDWKIQGD